MSAPYLDWPGLMAWSTKYHDGTKDSNFKMMSPEDRKFLQAAFADAMSQIENLNEILKEGLQKLEESVTFEEDGKSVKVNHELALVALECVDRCIDDPDCARNLNKFGGIRILLQNAVGVVLPKAESSETRLTFTPHSEVSLQCLEMLTLMIANNETLQLAAVNEHKALEYLLVRGQTISTDNPEAEPKLLKSRLSLVAAIVRGHPVLEEQFLSDNFKGLEWLCEFFSSEGTISMEERILRSAALFIRHLILEKPERCQVAGQDLVGKFLVPAYKEMDEESGVEYTEIVAQAGSIVCANSKEGKKAMEEELGVLVKKRMEFLIRNGEKESEIEIEGLKAMMTGVAKI